MRKNITLLISFSFLVTVLAKAPAILDVKVLNKTVNIVNKITEKPSSK